MDTQGRVDNWRAALDLARQELEAKRAYIKDLTERLAADSLLLEQEKRRDAFEETQERGRQWKKEHPEEHAAFLAEIRERNRQAVLDGAEQGWWDVDNDGNMLAPAIIIDSADLPEAAIMAHVMAKAGIFPSITQARKNGWDKPLTKGEFIVTKKKIRIRVI